MKRPSRLRPTFSAFRPAPQPRRSERVWENACLRFIFALALGFTLTAAASAQHSAVRFMPPTLAAPRNAAPDPTPPPAPTAPTTIRFGTPTPLPAVENTSPSVNPSFSPIQPPRSDGSLDGIGSIGAAPSHHRALQPLTPIRTERPIPRPTTVDPAPAPAPPRLHAPATTVRENGGIGPAGFVVPQALPLPPPPDREELDRVLRQGTELESEARWSDVLTFYETALRIYRNDTALMERFRLARFHYDIGRRFHDSSYLNVVRSASFVEALSLFDEILSRIQTNYVDMPHWDDLFRHGVQDVEIALSDPLFREKTGLNLPPEKLESFLETLRKTADGWEIRNREDLKNGILRLTEIAMQQTGLSPTAMLMEFTCGIVHSLDPYTAYLTPNQLNDTFSMISGNFVGLGVELKSDRESLFIVRVIPGSPAQEAGLHDGDRIHTVDGVSTKGRDTDSAADLLQGKEGTTVRLVVQSRNEKKRRELRITRRKIDVPSVEDVKMLNADLGYVKLTGFQSKTCLELKRAIDHLENRGMRCLVLDLRHNPGGLLQIGVEVANLFIEEGAIVRTRGRHNSLDTPYMATRENTLRIPLIVLIDEESASASEIVAGAIRDHQRGVLVGKRSYGKGTIQAILSVNGGSSNRTPAGLRLTVEKFYSPQGWPYSGVGVTPHVQVEQVEESRRVTLGKLINGRLQIPIASRTVSSSIDDPFIREAVNVSGQLLTNTASL